MNCPISPTGRSAFSVSILAFTNKNPVPPGENYPTSGLAEDARVFQATILTAVVASELRWSGTHDPREQRFFWMNFARRTSPRHSSLLPSPRGNDYAGFFYFLRRARVAFGQMDFRPTFARSSCSRCNHYTGGPHSDRDDERSARSGRSSPCL